MSLYSSYFQNHNAVDDLRMNIWQEIYNIGILFHSASKLSEAINQFFKYVT